MSVKKIELDNQIQILRRQMVALYNAKGCIDQEMLDLSIRIDIIINEALKLGKETS